MCFIKIKIKNKQCRHKMQKNGLQHRIEMKGNPQMRVMGHLQITTNPGRIY
jgi:hypothetical protein